MIVKLRRFKARLLSPLLRRRMAARANRINNLAGHIQSIDDAQRLVELIAADFSDARPAWATPSIRNHIARAEYQSAGIPGSLIPEQRVAEAWNDFLGELNVPQECCVTAAEIHALRDMWYVTSQIAWIRGSRNIWTIPNIYALGDDGKVANGSRALEVLNVLYQLSRQPEMLDRTREFLQKGQLWSDMFKIPSGPPAPGSEKYFVTCRVAPPNPVREAAQQYKRDHGVDALNSAIETLLKDLFEI